ncbi:hypothetical protein A2Z33_07645 [Candidatus Gottesmanbacteria bacterium RBG_16_52_11]|uniref:TrbL/VirB6 plasmid conjugal transfer protein n=1 Tax=Candidatus Gottesmanbacteria bacterium RBG_16_52_11 TaxID=1798374 RepID=A0A1F5YP44_9BACT|nr:MAG: hypothetical protein A2Z33_07645 [Candidatus Gottesmanbacteria bacterium RBG_16_52_11]
MTRIRALVPVLLVLTLAVLTIGGFRAAFASSDDPNPVDDGFDMGVYEGREKKTLSGEATGRSIHLNDQKNWLMDLVGSVPGVTTPPNAPPEYIEKTDNQSLAAGMETMYIAIYGNPPADLALWMRDTGESLGILPRSAYAQSPGVGFSGLAALLPLWKVFRNIAYLMLAFVMIVIGFMVMLRKKIDAKTVVTVQNAIPRVIVALILVTFSYAIIGFLIDAMYLVMVLTLNIISSAGESINPEIFNKSSALGYVTGNFMDVAGGFISGVIDSLDDVAMLLAGSAWKEAAATVGIAIGSIFTIIKGNVIEGAKGVLLVSALLAGIIALTVLIALARILVMLISAYIQLIIAVLFGPLQLMTSALPGSHAFENWIKNVISNLLVFPITAALIMIGQILVNTEMAGDQRLWGPPLLAPSGAKGMAGIIGIGLLFAIPSVVASVKQAFKAEPAIQAGPGQIFGTFGAAAGSVTQYLYQASMIRTLMPRGPQQQGGEGGGRGGGGHG